MKLQTNADLLVMQSVSGQVHSPIVRAPFRVDQQGQAQVLPATGGISYNVKVGDQCMRWVGDHVEPGVSIKNPDKEENNALNLFACIGNEAIIKSGDAKGDIGYVTGKHGGIDHVLIDFAHKTLEKMNIGDQILIKAYGQGLALQDRDDIVLMNIDPNLFDKLKLEINAAGKLEFPVVTQIPAHLMGSGLGTATAHSGDYDIMTGDEKANKKYNIDKLRFGDFVLLQDCDNTHGRQYLKSAVSIGVIVHSNCIKSGHGPGVTIIMSCKKPQIKAKLTSDANIVNLV